MLTFQYQPVIRAHWKFSGRICFLWKMLVMSTLKPLAGLCFMALPSPEMKQGRGFCHILHCPGQSSSFAQLWFFPEFRHRTKIHSACQNTELSMPLFFKPLLKNQFRYSHPPSDIITKSSCAMWAHPCFPTLSHVLQGVLCSWEQTELA